MLTIQTIRWDQWDGGDRQNFFGYLNAENNVDMLRTRFPHDAFTPVVITVYDDLNEVEANSAKNLLKTAWHKLTPQERAVLGLPAEEPK